MVEDRSQLVVRAQLKKLIKENSGPEAVAGLVEHWIHRDSSQEEVLEELIGWLLLARDSFKHDTRPEHAPFAQFLSGFQQVAQRRNIDPERFYAAALERIFLEVEIGESTREHAKHSTKDKILNAALDVFAKKGFHLATVDEIAECAGVGKGTLYRYFVNKETLFNELIRLRLEELERSVLAVLDGQDDVLTMITKYVRAYFEFFDRNQSLYRLIALERLDVGHHVQDLYVKKVMRRIPLLKRKIYGASQRGELKDVDFQTVFYGVMGFIHGVIQKWLARDCSYSLVEELPAVLEVLFYGFVKDCR